MLAAVAYDGMKPLGARRLTRDIRHRTTASIPTARSRRGDSKEMLAHKVMCQETAELAGSLGNLPLAVPTSKI
jgi:hypothetical protein